MKKIRITIINGSYHQKGKTIGIANEFTSLLEKKLYKYTLVINRIELNNSKLETCRGCKNCFSNGICRLDKIDDMHKIKRILCMSDVVIFSSPVYLKMITASMKLILDRLAYWTHIFKLHNTLGIIVLSAATSGINETNAYLMDILSHLGISVIGTIYNDIYCEKNYTNFEIDRIATMIERIIKGKEEISNDLLERYFKSFQYVYKEFVKNNKYDAEINYLLQNDYLSKKTYLQLLEDNDGENVDDE